MYRKAILFHFLKLILHEIRVLLSNHQSVYHDKCLEMSTQRKKEREKKSRFAFIIIAVG